MNKRSRHSLTRLVQVTPFHSVTEEARVFFDTLREKKDVYCQYLKDCLTSEHIFVFGGPLPSTVCLFHLDETPSAQNFDVLSNLCQLADSVTFKSLPHSLSSCTSIQIHHHITLALHSNESLLPWKGGIEDYLEACGADRENGLLVYSLLQWMWNHFTGLLDYVSGQMEIIGKNALPTLDIMIVLGLTTSIQTVLHSPPPPLLHSLDSRLMM